MTDDRMNRAAFRYAGVTFLLPGEIDESYQIKLKAVPDWIPIQTEGFTLIRIIANIALCRKGTTTVLTKFVQPIELQVNYTMDDLVEAGGNIDNLRLAYWDMHNWVIIGYDEHSEYQIFPPSEGQIAKVKINSWADDPTLAWGK